MDQILLYGGGVIGGVLGIAAFFVLIGILKSTIRVAPPDKVMVVTGKKSRRGGRTFGFSVDRGRTMVLPYFQSVGSLDLGVIPVTYSFRTYVSVFTSLAFFSSF